MASYAVEAGVLLPYVPSGTSIDIFEGQVFLSLVAFLFEDLRVLGAPIPFHRKFEEVNLRFYVKPDKDPSIRAVTFIQEIAPKAAVRLVANGLFSENYKIMPMAHGSGDENYWYSWGSNRQHRFSAKVMNELNYPTQGSIAEFITEHYWGYSQGSNRTFEYFVEHPAWKTCEVVDFEVAVDFAECYGRQFAFLNQRSPSHVVYAEGSAVRVSFPGRL